MCFQTTTSSRADHATANAPPADQPLNPQDGAGAGNPDGDRYVISIKQVAKFVVGLGEHVSPTDIEEGMRVGVDRTNYKILIPLPPKIDPSVTMMQVEERPSVTYADVGGCKEQIEKLREVVELPLLEVSTGGGRHSVYLLTHTPSLSALPTSVSSHPRVCCSTALREPARRCVPVPSPTELTRPSSEVSLLPQCDRIS